jgi:SAM-dependent methyltransferase
MRSCIDHFLNPELAVREAFRVLKPAGQLIVGLYVYGGRTGRDINKNKERLKSLLIGLGMSRFKDHHVWHPTYVELCGLLSGCGFSIDHTHWQAGQRESVCYIRAIKR